MSISIFRFVFRFSVAIICVLLLLCVADISAIPIKIDTSFQPKVSSPDYFQTKPFFEADGKVLTMIEVANPPESAFRYRLTRFNADGSFNRFFDVYSDSISIYPALQPDGKIIIGGSNFKINGVSRKGLVRLFTDGSFDSSLNATWILSARLPMVQPDGKIVAGVYYQHPNTLFYYETRRLNPDGSRDDTFTYSSTFSQTRMLADGKYLGCLYYLTDAWVYKFNADGSSDSSFVQNLPRNLSAFSYINSFDIATDGKIVAGGRGITKLNANGSLDTSFTPYLPPSNLRVSSVAFQPDGKILAVLRDTYYVVPAGQQPVIRLNADGSLDNSFDFSGNFANYELNIDEILKDSLDNFYAFGFSTHRQTFKSFQTVKLQTSGSFDESFRLESSQSVSSPSTMKILSNGKIIITGNFSQVNSTPSKMIARLNPDGTTDTTFTPPANISGGIYRLTELDNDKLLLAGKFVFPDGSEKYVIRLNQNGSFDSSFIGGVPESTYPSQSVNDMKQLSGGKVLLSGWFSNYNNSGRKNLIRLNADGTVDLTYQNITTATSVSEIVPLKEGGFMIALGGGANIHYHYKLNPAGDFASPFDVPLYSGSIKVQLPSGKFLSGDYFSNPCGGSYGMFRINQDGSRDTVFRLGSSSTLLPIIAGQNVFALKNDSTNQIIRLLDNGSQDTSFNLSFVDNGYVSVTATANPTENRMLVYGKFKSVNSIPRFGIARLIFTPAPFDFDNDGRTDLSVYRPSSTQFWWLRSSDNNSRSEPLGTANDILVPADYTGDGKIDIAVFRPSSGQWILQKSEDSTLFTLNFGTNGDVPVPADYDGDGKDNFAVFRPSNGTWYIINSTLSSVNFVSFGANGDKPVVADYDGDSKADVAVFRQNGNSMEWWRINSIDNQVSAHQFGIVGDKAVPSDYTGDGKADVAVWRPSDGGWYILRSEDLNFYAFPFGTASDKPVPGDYDGDNKTDAAVFRESEGRWYINGTFSGIQLKNFGTKGDVPIPNVFVR